MGIFVRNNVTLAAVIHEYKLLQQRRRPTYCNSALSHIFRTLYNQLPAVSMASKPSVHIDLLGSL